MGKTKAKKPTQKQKAHISVTGLNPKDFLILEETAKELILVRRGDGARVTITKKPKEKRR